MNNTWKSFWNGFFNVFNIFPEIEPLDIQIKKRKILTDEEAKLVDAESIANDWEKIIGKPNKKEKN